MIVTDGQQSLTEKVRQIIIALANRLTARENFGPEGLKGQVLTSNGEGPDDPPPSYQDIGSSISNNPALKGEKGDQGEQGPQGDPGPAGADGAPGSDGMVPTYIGPTETFTVPANKQALYALPIVNDGSLVVTGDLVMVD